MKSNNQYVLTPVGVVNIIITLIMLFIVGGAIAIGAYWVITLKTFLFISMYLFLALNSGNSKYITDAISYIVLIRSDDEIDATEKLTQIRYKIDELVHAYNNVFTELRVKSPKYKVLSAIRTEIEKAIHGEITRIQGLWVFGYMTYLIFIQTNYFNIPLPFDITTSIAFNMLLQYTSHNLRGVGGFIADIRKSALNQSKSSDILLREITLGIRELCLNYYIIAKAIESKFGKPIHEILYPKQNQIKYPPPND